MIRRNLSDAVLASAARMPVVAVTGPRQSGKTTLCRSVFPGLDYVSLEPLDVREFAQSDPRGFLGEHRDGAILDEIQRAPELMSYLQAEVDERPEPGRFVLTGSQHLGLTEAITQSLAGRVAVHYLLPPSLDELARFGPLPEDLWQVVWAGAYPRIFDRGLDPARWLADYVTTYLQRDVRQVRNVSDLEAFTTFLRLLAGRTSAELNLASLGADAGLTHPTVRSWISVLEATFVCFRLPAWRANPRKQTVKSSKVHFVDSGVACYLLGISAPEQLRHHPLRGALFETWVAAEILKARLHRALPERLFHLRESRGSEIDLVIESGGEVVGVEAKSGATVAPDFFVSLRRLGEDLAARGDARKYRPVVVYGGREGQRRSDIEVLPWRSIQEIAW